MRVSPTDAQKHQGAWDVPETAGDHRPRAHGSVSVGSKVHLLGFGR